jgi:hypothetical protein
MRDRIRYALAIDDGFPVECKQGSAQFCVNSLQTDLYKFAGNGDGHLDFGVLLPLQLAVCLPQLLISARRAAFYL